MSRSWQIAVVAAGTILLALNLVLLDRMEDLRELNATLAHKVTPSLVQQFHLLEHSMEGESLAHEIASFSRDAGADLLAKDRHTLLFYFPGENCRRNLHMEISVFNSMRSRLDGLKPVMVFADFQETDFRLLAQQYSIDGVSILDREHLLRQRLGVRFHPLVLLLDDTARILYARVSRTEDEPGSRQLYSKIQLLQALLPLRHAHERR
ncbi:MAG TPA: hypothetical protein VNW71_09455 [Thermoanaerobaculia bacterium]|nr:hypothetical protein [Thermoanaerobaculia bacterium]